MNKSPSFHRQATSPNSELPAVFVTSS